MGWASGGAIFDRVADGLMAGRASDDTMRTVLGPLIDELQQNDWDTEGESLERYAKVPVIVQLFAERGIELPVPDSPCQVVVVDGHPVRVQGGAPFSAQDTEMFSEIVRAAMRRYTQEHPS